MILDASTARENHSQQRKGAEQNDGNSGNDNDVTIVEDGDKYADGVKMVKLHSYIAQKSHSQQRNKPEGGQRCSTQIRARRRPSKSM